MVDEKKELFLPIMCGDGEILAYIGYGTEITSYGMATAVETVAKARAAVGSGEGRDWVMKIIVRIREMEPDVKLVLTAAEIEKDGWCTEPDIYPEDAVFDLMDIMDFTDYSDIDYTDQILVDTYPEETTCHSWSDCCRLTELLEEITAKSIGSYWTDEKNDSQVMYFSRKERSWL